MKKMQQYIQEINSFFRIAPHLKDNTLYSIVFWYYMVIWFEIGRNITKKPIYSNVLSILLYFAYGLFLLYNTLYFMKVWFGFIIILELTSRILKGNQYLFDRLSWVYGPALKNKFGVKSVVVLPCSLTLSSFPHIDWHICRISTRNDSTRNRCGKIHQIFLRNLKCTLLF